MVGSPDSVQKNVVLENNSLSAEQITTIECKSNDFRKPYDSYLYSHRTPSETWKENRVITEVC